MLPYDVLLAIAVEIARASDLPIRVRYLIDAECRRANHRDAVHLPRGQPPLRLVPPEQIV